MIAATIDMAFVALTTLATVVMIGIGFLPHPSRATATWSLGFAMSMIASYAWVAADLLFPDQLQALSSGGLLGSVAVMWVGLRFHRGAARSCFVLVAVYVVVSLTALLVSAGTVVYGLVFRAVFVVAAAFAVLIVVELLRIGPRRNDAVLPLLLTSALFPAVAAFAVIEGIVQVLSGSTGEDLSGPRSVNNITGIVYVVCALLTLLLLARGTAPLAEGGASSFEAIARDRLERAERAADAWWSLVDISLDDPDAVRTVFGSSQYAAITERFRTTVMSVLPPDADVERIDATRFVALLPRSPEAVRQILIRLLETVADGSPESQFSVRVSASIGWAQVTSAGYNLDSLRTAAGHTLDLARTSGGGQWERMPTPRTGSGRG